MCRGINYEACSTVNDMWNLWKDSFMLLCDKHAPMKVFRVRNDGDTHITHRWIMILLN